MTKAWKYLVVLISIVIMNGQHVDQVTAGQSATRLAAYEAEILVFELPQCREVRDRGLEITLSEDKYTSLNLEDFYHFSVYSDDPKAAGSSLVGRFSVNRFTAEVWNRVTAARIQSRDLEGLQRILRNAHNIDMSTIERFGNRELETQ
jgi:hypothetical protein